MAFSSQFSEGKGHSPAATGIRCVHNPNWPFANCFLGEKEKFVVLDLCWNHSLQIPWFWWCQENDIIPQAHTRIFVSSGLKQLYIATFLLGSQIHKVFLTSLQVIWTAVYFTKALTSCLLGVPTQPPVTRATEHLQQLSLWENPGSCKLQVQMSLSKYQKMLQASTSPRCTHIIHSCCSMFHKKSASSLLWWQLSFHLWKPTQVKLTQDKTASWTYLTVWTTTCCNTARWHITMKLAMDQSWSTCLMTAKVALLPQTYFQWQTTWFRLAQTTSASLSALVERLSAELESWLSSSGNSTKWEVETWPQWIYASFWAATCFDCKTSQMWVHSCTKMFCGFVFPLNRKLPNWFEAHDENRFIVEIFNFQVVTEVQGKLGFSLVTDSTMRVPRSADDLERTKVTMALTPEGADKWRPRHPEDQHWTGAMFRKVFDLEFAQCVCLLVCLQLWVLLAVSLFVFDCFVR